MVNYIDLLTMKSKSLIEQKNLIQSFITLKYSTEELRKISKLAEEILKKPIDHSQENVIKLWTLAILAADISTSLTYTPYREEYKKNLEILCKELDEQYEDIVKLTAKSEEMIEWFSNNTK